MHSSVLTSTVSVLGHMSASGSRGITHRHSSVVAVARSTGKISCFPPPLVCIRTVSAHADSLMIDPSWPRIRRVDFLALRRHTHNPRTALYGALTKFLRRLEAEFGAVPPHCMHDDRELARHRHAGAPVAALLGNLQPPRLQAAEASKARQHDVGRLVEQMPDLPISRPGDVALHVDRGAGLPASRGQPEIGSDRLGMAEPLRIIDRRLVD